MRNQFNIRWSMLIAVNAVLFCVLVFYRGLDAAQPSAKQPFANSVEQREAMITELKAVVAELKQQNELLRSGKLKVIIASDNTK